jgi:polyisoprenoid-binding protein YceI
MISKTLLLALSLSSLQSFAGDLTVKMTLSPAGGFEAKTVKLHGDVTKAGEKYSSDSLWVKTEDLKTGIDLRDEHFHKHLNFEKSPKITMNNIAAENGKGSGTLTVNGVSNKVDFIYKQAGDKKLQANFKVKPSAFKLKEAKYLEIGVEDEVEVVANIDVK